MKCKICYKNETDNTSEICWECLGKSYFDNIIFKEASIKGHFGDPGLPWEK